MRPQDHDTPQTLENKSTRRQEYMNTRSQIARATSWDYETKAIATLNPHKKKTPRVKNKSIYHEH